MKRLGLFLGFLMLLVQAVPAQDKKMKAEPPKVVVVAPLGLNPGAKTKVAIRGLKLDNAVEVRFAVPGVTAKVLKTAKTPVANNQEPTRLGDSLVEAEITLPADLPAGEVLLQVITPTAETPPHKLLINATPPLAEKEPNNGFRQLQAITVSTVLDGTIQNNQDVDVFQIEGKEGQQLVIEVLAARLGSPVDGSLTLFNSMGQVVASHDDSTDSVDPHLEVTLPRTGTYFLSLMDVHDQGGPQFVYRLIIK